MTQTSSSIALPFPKTPNASFTAERCVSGKLSHYSTIDKGAITVGSHPSMTHHNNMSDENARGGLPPPVGGEFAEIQSLLWELNAAESLIKRRRDELMTCVDVNHHPSRRSSSSSTDRDPKSRIRPVVRSLDERPQCSTRPRLIRAGCLPLEERDECSQGADGPKLSLSSSTAANHCKGGKDEKESATPAGSCCMAFSGSSACSVLPSTQSETHFEHRRSVVEINVGGTSFAFSLACLSQYPTSILFQTVRLSLLLQQSRQIIVTDDRGTERNHKKEGTCSERDSQRVPRRHERMFFDRDPEQFRLMALMIRGYPISNMNLRASALRELYAECEYFGLEGLYELNFPKVHYPFVAQYGHRFFFAARESPRMLIAETLPQVARLGAFRTRGTSQATFYIHSTDSLLIFGVLNNHVSDYAADFTTVPGCVGYRANGTLISTKTSRGAMMMNISSDGVHPNNPSSTPRRASEPLPDPFSSALLPSSSLSFSNTHYSSHTLPPQLRDPSRIEELVSLLRGPQPPARTNPEEQHAQQQHSETNNNNNNTMRNGNTSVSHATRSIMTLHDGEESHGLAAVVPSSHQTGDDAKPIRIFETQKIQLQAGMLVRITMNLDDGLVSWEIAANHGKSTNLDEAAGGGAGQLGSSTSSSGRIEQQPPLLLQHSIFGPQHPIQPTPMYHTNEGLPPVVIPDGVLFGAAAARLEKVVLEKEMRAVAAEDEQHNSETSTSSCLGYAIGVLVAYQARVEVLSMS